MMISLGIWGATLFAYLLFLAWHENWHGALKQDEIAAFTARLEADGNLDDALRGTLIKFMQDDTGDEFFMVNMVAHHKGKIADPDTGAPVSAVALLNKYFRPFIGKLFRSAGYPAITGAVVGDYIDAWNTSANPGWSGSGLIRYRSRRDLMLAATDASFAAGHKYKQLALAVTFAVPIEGQFGFFVSPRIWVALLVLLAAAFGQIAYLV